MFLTEEDTYGYNWGTSKGNYERSLSSLPLIRLKPDTYKYPYLEDIELESWYFYLSTPDKWIAHMHDTSHANSYRWKQAVQMEDT